MNMGKPLRFPKIELCKLQDLPLPKLVFLNAITHPLTIVIACYTYQKPNHHEPTITSINQYQALKSKLVYQHLPTIQTIPILTIVPPHKKNNDVFGAPKKPISFPSPGIPCAHLLAPSAGNGAGAPGTPPWDVAPDEKRAAAGEKTRGENPGN